MVSNELFEWLDTLGEGDCAAFDRYLQSAEHKRKRLPFQLYQWLIAHPEEWKGQGGHEFKRSLQQSLHDLLFPQEALKPQRIRRVFMELKQLLEGFIALHASPRLDPRLDHEIRMLKYLQERGASRLFQSRLADLEHYLETKADLSADTYLVRVWMEQMRSEYHIHHNIAGDAFEAANLAACKSYLIRTLENFTGMRTREQFNPGTHDYLFEAEVRQILEAQTLQNDDLLNLWKHQYLLAMPGATTQHYVDAEVAMEKIKHRLPLLTLRQVRARMFNYLVQTQELGNRASYRRLWELMRVMQEEKTLHMPDGRLTFPFFIAAVRSACLCGEHVWAEQFVSQCKGDLLGDGREEQIQYCSLLVDFYGGKLLEVWRNLLIFHPKDLRLEAFSRTLQVQIAYDLQKEDEFFRHVDSLGKFISRNLELGTRFTGLMQEFARFAERLGHAAFVSHRLPKGLAARLAAHDAAEKIWLLEKVDEFEK